MTTQLFEWGTRAAMEQWITLVEAILTAAAALMGLNMYLGRKSKRERTAEVGRAFAEVVAGLSSDKETEQIANAALIRRFWDRTSEHGAGGAPYADDAARVVAALLRKAPTGEFQKLLADGLAASGSLAKADLQRVNLEGAYWGAAGNTPVRIDGSDFFAARLARASFRGASLRFAQLCQTSCVDTVFAQADCTGANFSGADLRGASFRRTVLTDAVFTGAKNIPEAVAEALDDEGVYRGTSPHVQASSPAIPGDVLRVFVSAPSALVDEDRVALNLVLQMIDGSGAQTVQLLPADYSSNPLKAVSALVQTCHGAIVFGAPQTVVEVGRPHHNRESASEASRELLPTPWNQIEAGMASALDLPLLILRRSCGGGVFDLPDEAETIKTLDLDQPRAWRRMETVIAEWINSLPGSGHP